MVIEVGRTGYGGLSELVSEKSGKAAILRRVAVGAVAVLIGVAIGAALVPFFGERGNDEVGRAALEPDDPQTATTEAPEIPPDDSDIADGASPREPLQTVVVEDWEAGLAASLECNLVSDPDFETPDLPRNFFLDLRNQDREIVVPGEGLEGTGALEIGDPGVSGIYGEIIPVEPGRQYIVSLNSRIDGEVSAADVRLDWVNSEFAVIGSSQSLDLVERPPGQYAFVTDGAPTQAGYGVARIFKDDGEGLLYVDEVVVTRSDSACSDLLLG